MGNGKAKKEDGLQAMPDVAVEWPNKDAAEAARRRVPRRVYPISAAGEAGRPVRGDVA